MTVIFFDLQLFAGVNKENSSSNITFSGTTYNDTLENSGENIVMNGSTATILSKMVRQIMSHSTAALALIQSS